MYWKKKPTQNTGSINFRNQLSLDNGSSTLAPAYEISNRKPLPSTSYTPASVKTTALDKEKDEDGPIYECAEPIDGYAEMS